MAKKTTPELHPDEEAVLEALAAAEEDPVGAELEAAIRANKALLTGLQHFYAQQMEDALEGGDPPAASELLQLKKLEREIQNDEAYVEARKLTRRRSGTAA